MRRADRAEVGTVPALHLQRALQQESGAVGIIRLHALFAAICFSISLIVRRESLPLCGCSRLAVTDLRSALMLNTMLP